MPPPFDTDVPALLFRVDRNPFHHGTLGAVRSLGRAGIEVHAVVESPLSPIGRSRYLHQGHHLPADGVFGTHRTGETVDADGTSDERLERTLRQISDRIGRPAVLIPMDDMGAIAAARLSGRLSGRFLLPAQPPGLPSRVADKAELAELCRELDVPHPPTVVPRGVAEVEEAVRELGLPLVAKWSRPWLLPQGSGLRSTTLVGSAEEARALYARTGEAGSPLLLQRCVPGGPGTDWFFHGCYADGAACLVGGAGRKDRSWPVGAGLTAVGRWLPNPDVEEAAHRLAKHLDYRGILDLDFRYDAAAGSYRLLDFNPRPGAQFRLFTDRRGLDVVRALHLDLTGRPVTPSEPALGRVFRAENYALASSLVEPSSLPLPFTAARRARAVPEIRTDPEEGGRVRWRRRRNTETAWFAADDPGPFLAMAATWLGQGGRKALRRSRERMPRPSRQWRSEGGTGPVERDLRAERPERPERHTDPIDACGHPDGATTPRR
ncbi:ATP-grasp domain-containing protein [Streptomyces taklimakanensis]|uniref:carboxylate--amine ligase n=1 Tax=Streptomyces taklimakanensis TaxID=2569853 RepID=UPI00192E6B33|nr:ATP-grasp domain-containing protein [Streptomyces taklimakanensis]